MNAISRFALLFSLVLASNELAQAKDDYFAVVFAEAQCNGATAVIDIDLSMIGPVPTNIVGWVVDREVLGACGDRVQIGPVRSFPLDQQQYQVTDIPVVPNRKTIYYVFAVDTDGNRSLIPWPQRSPFTQADCLGGAAARGTVVELFPGFYHLDVCPDTCWWELSQFDSSLPPEAATLVGQLIDVYGQIYFGLEGPVIDVAGWSPAPQGCEVVIPVQDMSWSGMKGRFR